MSKIPTAEEFINQQFEKQIINEDIYASKQGIIDNLIIFTKLHVEAALKEASEKAKRNIEYIEGTNIKAVSLDVDKNSILNSYPLEVIK